MIFAAGLGTRLKPLTNNKPKALIEVNNITIIERIIKRFIEANICEIVINVHHFPEKILEFLHQNKNFGIDIVISDETDLLLETGGGLKKASWFFDDNKPFFVHNADVLTNLSLSQMLDFHVKNKSLATLAVRNRKTSRYFLFDNESKLCGWQNTEKNEIIHTRSYTSVNQLAFSGVQIISPEIFNYLNQKGPFSITKSYIELSKSNIISAYQHDNDFWFDIGTLEKLNIANEFYKKLEK